MRPASRPVSSGTTWSARYAATASSRPLSVASPSPVSPSSVVMRSVTKFRPGLATSTSATAIFIVSSVLAVGGAGGWVVTAIKVAIRWTPVKDLGDRRVVLMGVSGSGKTAIGSRLAGRLGWSFIEADDYPPAANIPNMSGGLPLTSADRRPWVAAVARQLAAEHHAIAACSALRRSYRDQIAGAVPGTFFVHLTVPAATLARRMRARDAHFMPVSLLDSQTATLEP